MKVDTERVRELAEQRAPDDETPLDFYSAARDLGASEDEAERVDVALTERVMRARGAL